MTTPNNPPTESVWDYPRPPRLEPTPSHIRIHHHGVLLADTTRALRILETSHPPVFYIPPADIAMHLLQPSNRRSSFCEFKGTATYWTIHIASALSPDAAWSYAHPTPPFAALRNHLAFYASRVDECTVDGERVTPQPGDFYGGWITSRIRGPFKGPPGTLGW
ncbi:MAG: DUF427 domain-containing protein [Acidobacteria bacterium]|nr:DUF427 domain-containing protein [Acidobacteriota bacterium]